MSPLTSSTNTSNRWRLKRTALVLSAGLFAATLAIGGGLAANAAPAALSATTATEYGVVTVTVTGFTPSEPLTLNFDSTTLSNNVADGTGAYTGTLSIPAGATLGAHTIDVVGTVSPTQSATITIIAQPTASPATASVTASTFGTTGVTVAFSGYTPGDSVQFGGGTGGSGGPFATPPVTVGASGVATYTLRYSDFGSGAALPGVYYVSAPTVAGNINTDFATITVAADPAAPVKATARFAG